MKTIKNIFYNYLKRKSNLVKAQSPLTHFRKNMINYLISLIILQWLRAFLNDASYLHTSSKKWKK